ncbi:uncharacterized protein ACNLHF_008115 isoform 2-T2 [Anomaloglossus baeobatrachus]|uniref:uncharacterized protein LOC142289838 isoform X2 n=1 Tax=Anomaloglossus baeobatrachus TaxID=238106 RepID=UPI003F4FFE0A
MTQPLMMRLPRNRLEDLPNYRSGWDTMPVKGNSLYRKSLQSIFDDWLSSEDEPIIEETPEDAPSASGHGTSGRVRARSATSVPKLRTRRRPSVKPSPPKLINKCLSDSDDSSAMEEPDIDGSSIHTERRGGGTNKPRPKIQIPAVTRRPPNPSASNSIINQECMSRSEGRSFVGDEACKYFTSINKNLFSSGKMVIAPEKVTESRSFLYTTTYYVEKGEVKLQLRQSEERLKAGKFFFVPPGHHCKITNLLAGEAVLVYSKFKLA